VISIDASVLVRFVVNDDREQARRARALVKSFDVFVTTSVLLETEWVLRSNYKITGQKIFDALRAFLALPRVIPEDEKAAQAALDWAGQGMDFADALHLAGSSECEVFASFDRGLSRIAAKVGALTVRAPP
jgi:predicted nucleic acid-binding protein